MKLELYEQEHGFYIVSDLQFMLDAMIEDIAEYFDMVNRKNIIKNLIRSRPLGFFDFNQAILWYKNIFSLSKFEQILGVYANPNNSPSLRSFYVKYILKLRDKLIDKYSNNTYLDYVLEPKKLIYPFGLEYSELESLAKELFEEDLSRIVNDKRSLYITPSKQYGEEFI